MLVFTFHPRWKEELVCTAPGGSFVLTLDMGILTAHLPTEAIWVGKAPDWAKSLWPVLHEELTEWCLTSGADIFLDGSAPVY
ncbi:hypothetical protein [Luteibacter sp.]|uniref:hypothetical protein n=1 Tax=Luteibacter sp. TaxID=1886636 RepID=UPI0025C39678|nr:hypothetical protein [Luteibacter sp.]